MKIIKIIKDNELAQELSKINLTIGQKVQSCLFNNIQDKIHKYFPGITQYTGFIEGNDGYYTYSCFKIKHNYCERLEKNTNFIIKIKNKILSINPNNEDKNQCIYEITVFIDGKEINISVTLFELQNPDSLVRIISKQAFAIASVEKSIFKTFINNELKEANNLAIIIETELAGYNKNSDNEYFVTADKCFGYADNPKPNVNIKLSPKSYLQPIFKTTKDILSDKNFSLSSQLIKISPDKEIIKAILLNLFSMLKKAYNDRIEPFLALGISYIFIYLNAIYKDFEGIPIVVLCGEPASGKTNLLRLVAYSYGLTPSSLHSGMDTPKSILQDFNNLSNIPMLIDEIENNITEIKSLIKNVYGQNQRKTCYSTSTIKSTIFMNTNHKFLHDLEYKNRCIELDFEQENFKPDEAKKFNDYQAYLSLVTAYLIENISYQDIKTMIENEEDSELLSDVSDSRIKRNLAIAISGLKLLIKLINQEDEVSIRQFNENLVTYIKGIQSIYEEDVDRFISVLKEIFDSKNCKLVLGKDYKILENGIHLLITKKNKSFEQQFKRKFKSMYEQVKPLELKTYSKLLKKYGAKMNNSHYPIENSTLYGLFLPFEKFSELIHLKQRSIISKNNSEKDVFF